MSFHAHATPNVLLALLVLPSLALGQDDAVATCSQDEWDEYYLGLQNHVKSNWKRPSDNRAISCTMVLRLDFRSEVEDVEILSCNDDARVRKSAEDAGYTSSPMPVPTNKACFSKQITIRLEFTPQYLKRPRMGAPHRHA